MSLTSFINEKDVKRTLREEFPKPKFRLEGKLLAPPLTERYMLVGTAFDYAFRFHLRRLNRKAVENGWVAHKSLRTLGAAMMNAAEQMVLVGPECYQSRPTEESAALYDGFLCNFAGTIDLYRAARDRVLDVEGLVAEYRKSGKLGKDVLSGAFAMAALDGVYRGGLTVPPAGGWGSFYKHQVESLTRQLDTVDGQDLADLRRLVRVLRDRGRQFRARQVCVLNPTFRGASPLVGSADADVLLDDMLLEVKTTKHLKLTRAHFNQLLGYYILSRIGGIDGVPGRPAIRRLGIYYSRHGQLVSFPVSDVLPRRGLPKFLKWFQKRAKQSFGKRRR